MSFIEWLDRKIPKALVAEDMTPDIAEPVLTWEINGDSLTAQFDTPTSQTWFVIVPIDEGYLLTHDRLDTLKATLLGAYESYPEAQGFAEDVATGVARELNNG